jgi:hypothetical protein
MVRHGRLNYFNVAAATAATVEDGRAAHGLCVMGSAIRRWSLACRISCCPTAAMTRRDMTLLFGEIYDQFTEKACR